MKREPLPAFEAELSKEESQRRINDMLLWLQDDGDRRPDQLHPQSLAFAQQFGIVGEADWQRLRQTIQRLSTETSTVIMLKASGVHDSLLNELIEDAAHIQEAMTAFSESWQVSVQAKPAAAPAYQHQSGRVQPEESSTLGADMSTEDSEDRRAIDIETLYFNDVKREPLLSKDEEVMLAKVIEAGVLAEEALTNPERRAEVNATDQELEQLVRDGQLANERFIRSNLRLVAFWASRYRGRGLEKLDLIQEGTFGLMHAIEMYDYAKGYTFSTYASTWIRQSLDRAIANKSSAVRIPVHRREDIRKLHRIENQLLDACDVVNDHILADRLGWSLEKLTEVRRAREQARPLISLNSPVDDSRSEGTEFGDLISDEDIVPNDDRLTLTELHQTLHSLLDTLPSWEQYVLSKRMGLDGTAPMTLRAIGELLGVSRERVRQVEAKALSKLRHPSRSGPLRSLRRGA